MSLIIDLIQQQAIRGSANLWALIEREDKRPCSSLLFTSGPGARLVRVMNLEEVGVAGGSLKSGLRARGESKARTWGSYREARVTLEINILLFLLDQVGGLRLGRPSYSSQLPIAVVDTKPAYS